MLGTTAEAKWMLKESGKEGIDKIYSKAMRNKAETERQIQKQKKLEMYGLEGQSARGLERYGSLEQVLESRDSSKA